MFTTEQLDGRSDLLPVFNGNTVVLYVRDTHPHFSGDYSMMIHGLRKSGDLDNVFQRCLSTSKSGQELYFPLEDFRPTATGWESSLHDAAKAVTRAGYQATRDKNLPFLRMYMMGDVDTNIVCPITGQQVDAWVFDNQPINIWEQHHFKVRNRASIQKELADPGEILRRLDFTEVSGETVEAIKDMMRTVFLSPTAHKAVHNAWNDSDIRNYRAEQRPWALRDCGNWDKWMDFLQSYGYPIETFGPFGPWIISLELTEAEKTS